MTPEQFKKYRKGAKLTQAQLSKVLKKSVTQIKNYEWGKTPISSELAFKVEVMAMASGINIYEANND